MAKSAVWRITAVDTQGRDLVLSRLRLLASSTRVDSGAVLTCTAGLVSGSLSDLLEDSADSCMFAAVDVSAPGFQFVFTLPAEQEVDGVELGLVGSTTAPVALTLECVESGRFVTVKEFRGIETSGAPVAVQVGEVASGSQEQGYIVALRSGSARPQLNAFDRAAATWAENFAQTIDIGLFANAGTNPGDTGVLATRLSISLRSKTLGRYTRSTVHGTGMLPRSISNSCVLTPAPWLQCDSLEGVIFLRRCFTARLCRQCLKRR